LLLNERLDSDAQAGLMTHLESCTKCQRQLERLAGDDTWWNEVSTALAEDDETSAEQLLPVSDSRPAGNPLDDVAFTGHGPISLEFLEPSADPLSLGCLGKYEVLSVIGHGGMGVVLKAFDAELNRFVAVKVLSPCFASSGAARKRFAREAQAAAAVVHPHVMAIHGIDASANLPYLVMPYVQGQSLEQRIRREGPLELREIVRIAAQTAAGLAAAHAQGLVHRDIKPANILLEHQVGRVVITDFGLARAVDDATLTHSGVIAGTPQYMSPEQATGEDVDHRSDLFSLGSVMYAMCTGEAPFRATSTLGVLRRVCDAQPRPIRELNPDIPRWLVRFVERLQSKSPADRWQSAREVAELLEQCLAHVQQPDRQPLPAVLHHSGSPRWMAGAAILALCVIGLWGVSQFGATLNEAKPLEHPAADTRAAQIMAHVTEPIEQPAEIEPDAILEQITEQSMPVESPYVPLDRWFELSDWALHDIETELEELDEQQASREYE
jgi:serine/threonine-protein kinase